MLNVFSHGDRVEFRDYGDTWIVGDVMGVFRDVVAILVGKDVYEHPLVDVRHAQV